MAETLAAFGLPASSVRAIRLVLARHTRVVQVDVYGSRAMDRFRPGSDIDLTLRGERLTAADLLAIDREIDALDLPYKVDLSIYHQIEDAALRAHIDRVGRPLYQVAQP